MRTSPTLIFVGGVCARRQRAPGEVYRKARPITAAAQYTADHVNGYQLLATRRRGRHTSAAVPTSTQLTTVNGSLSVPIAKPTTPVSTRAVLRSDLRPVRNAQIPNSSAHRAMMNGIVCEMVAGVQSSTW